MNKNTTPSGTLSMEARDVLSDYLHQGACEMLTTAIEAEVQAYLDRFEHCRDEKGHRLVVRNGTLPGRTIQTPIGNVPIEQPRVNDKRIDANGQRCKFTSAILPPYLRRTKSIEELIPWLYLKGISTGDFTEALQALLGPNASGLSPSTVVRLKEIWKQEWADWSKRSLADKQYVYLWADGVYFNVRLEDPNNRKQCILVLMGATSEGKKELIAITDGYRESEQSWTELLLDAKSRGLATEPKCAIGDGALGFWASLAKVYPTTRRQRCWVHKTCNVLNKMPKAIGPKAKAMLHEIWMAPTQADATKAFDLFVKTFQAKYPKAVECLNKDRAVLLTFYDFPAEHWVHLRTTNPIESMFATVRLRTHKTKGCGSRIASLMMVFKLAQSAQTRWRVLNGSSLLSEVIHGVKFTDGIKDVAA